MLHWSLCNNVLGMARININLNKKISKYEDWQSNIEIIVENRTLLCTCCTHNITSIDIVWIRYIPLNRQFDTIMIIWTNNNKIFTYKTLNSSHKEVYRDIDSYACCLATSQPRCSPLQANRSVIAGEHENRISRWHPTIFQYNYIIMTSGK